MSNDNLYNQHKYDIENLVIEKEKMFDFFKLIKLFMNFEYEDKVKYMNEHWGDIKENKTIYYGNKCKINIKIDEKQKYSFEFDFNNCSFEDFANVNPELANELFNHAMEEYAKSHPEVIPNSQQESSVNSDDNSQYLRLYNNIKVNKSDEAANNTPNENNSTPD